MVQEATLIAVDEGYINTIFTATPCKYPQGFFHKKECRTCEAPFEPLAPSHLYCSPSCKKEGRISKYYENAYGVTFKEVRAMFEKQNGVCAICKQVGFKMNKTLTYSICLDHCHNTKKVRGLLCPNCNRALGLFQDNKQFLRSAIEYLSNE